MTWQLVQPVAPPLWRGVVLDTALLPMLASSHQPPCNTHISQPMTLCVCVIVCDCVCDCMCKSAPIIRKYMESKKVSQTITLVDSGSVHYVCIHFSKILNHLGDNAHPSQQWPWQSVSVGSFASTVQFLCIFQFGRQDKGKSQCPYTDDVTECIVCVLGRDLFTCLSFFFFDCAKVLWL